MTSSKPLQMIDLDAIVAAAAVRKMDWSDCGRDLHEAHRARQVQLDGEQLERRDVLFRGDPHDQRHGTTLHERTPPPRTPSARSSPF